MRKTTFGLFLRVILALILVLSLVTLSSCVSFGGTGGGSGSGEGSGEGTGEGTGDEGTTPGGGDNTKPGDGTEDGDNTKPDDGTEGGDNTKPDDGTEGGDNTKPGDGTEGDDGNGEVYETSVCVGVRGSLEALYSDAATLYHGTRAPILAAFDGPRDEPAVLTFYTSRGALTHYTEAVEYSGGYYVHEFGHINYDYFEIGETIKCNIGYNLGEGDWGSFDFEFTVLPVGTEQADFVGVVGENDVYYSGNATVVAGSDKPFSAAFTSTVINPTVYLNMGNIRTYDTHTGFYLSDGLYVYEFGSFADNFEAGKTYTAEIEYTDARGELIVEEFTITVALESIGGGNEPDDGGENKPEDGEGEGGNEGGENAAYFIGAMTETMTGPDRTLWVELYKEPTLYLCFSGEVNISSVTLDGYEVMVNGYTAGGLGNYSVEILLPAYEKYCAVTLRVEYISGGETFSESVDVIYGSDMEGGESSVIFMGITDGYSEVSSRLDVMMGEEISFFLVFEGAVSGAYVETNGQSVTLGEGYLSNGRYYVPATMSPLVNMEMVIGTVTWDNMDSAAYRQFDICPMGGMAIPPEVVKLETTQSSDTYYESISVTLSDEVVYVSLYLTEELRDVSVNVTDIYATPLCSATVYSVDFGSEGYYVLTFGIDFTAMSLFVGEYYITVEGGFGNYESYPYCYSFPMSVTEPEAPTFLGVATDSYSDPTSYFSFSSGESFELWLVFDAPVEVRSVRLGDFSIGGGTATNVGKDYRAVIYSGADFAIYGTEGVVEYTMYGMWYSATFTVEQKRPELVKIVNALTYEDYTDYNSEGYHAEFVAGETVELIFVYTHRASEAYFYTNGAEMQGQVVGAPGDYDEKLGGYPVYYSITFDRVGVDKFPVVMYDESYSTNPGCEDVHIAFIANILPGELKAHGINTDGYTTDSHSVSFRQGESAMIYVMLSGYVDGMSVELQLYHSGDYYMNLYTDGYASYVPELGMYAVSASYYADFPGWNFDPSSGECSYKLDVLVDGQSVAVYVITVTSM